MEKSPFISRLRLHFLIAALFIASGLVGASWFVAQGMARLKTQDRFVTVKGLAEKTVDADLVIWTLPHNVSGNELADMQKRLDANTEVIRRFFIDSGFDANEIVVSPPQLEDRWQAYLSAEQRPAERFLSATTVILRTNRVAESLATLRRSGELISQGVQINASSRPEFKYTRLNDIKPALIAQATANARQSAEQFAKDSGSRIGGIRSANQGQVLITDRDQGSPQVKIVRVVSTIEYFLRD